MPDTGLEGDRPASEDNDGDTRYGDPAEGGDLLNSPDAGKILTKMYRDQHWLYERMLCEWEVNERRRSGEVNVWVDSTKGGGGYQVWSPPGRPRLTQNVVNKSDRLCHRLTAVLYADPPEPEVEASGGEDDDRDAAELATRILRDLQSETNLDDLKKHKLAHQRASSFGSGYVHYWVDPRGGGRQAVEVEASPQAQTVDDALQSLDTGVPWPVGELTTRYAMEDGTLTDDPGQAAMRWVPALAAEVIPASGVRCVPWTATSLSDADGVILTGYHPWHALAQRYPELADWSEEDRAKACQYRPAEAKGLLPLIQGKHKEPDTKGADEKLYLLTIGYFCQSGAYPDGVTLTVVGESQVVGAPVEWVGKVGTRREALDIPVVQLIQWYDPASPQGKGLMSILGSASEVRAHIYGVIEDLLDRYAARKVFVPVHSTYDPKNALLSYQTHIAINPGGEPKYEELPDVPQVTGTLLSGIDRDMDDASGLQESGQGLEVGSVTSGKQADAVLGQVQAGLSDLRQNAEAAYVRGCRIQLQLVANNFTVPQMVRYSGEDGKFKVQRWVGSDLKSTRDVRLKRGTMTMMSYAQKVEQVGGLAKGGWINPEDAGAFITGQVNPVMGMQDDAHLMRVRRQVARWEQGPPKDFVPPPVEAAPLPMPMLDQMGQPMPPPPPPNPFAALLAEIFDPRPIDAAPLVATKRVRELGLAMSGTKFGRLDPAWQAGLVEAYQSMVTALTPPAPPPAPPAAPPGPNITVQGVQEGSGAGDAGGGFEGGFPA